MPRPADDVARRLAAARAGSREALGEALDACRAYLLLIARQSLGADVQAKGGASDLVQETFLEAQRDFDRFQGTTAEELLAWLRRLLLNNVADFTRRYRDTAKRGAAREVSLGADPSGALHAGLATAGPSPSDQAVANEQAERFRRVLGGLPEDYRRVILLRYEGGHTFEEIGRELNRTPNAARMLWLRAIDRLKHELGISHEHPSTDAAG